MKTVVLGSYLYLIYLGIHHYRDGLGLWVWKITPTQMVLVGWFRGFYRRMGSQGRFGKIHCEPEAPFSSHQRARSNTSVGLAAACDSPLSLSLYHESGLRRSKIVI